MANIIRSAAPAAQSVATVSDWGQPARLLLARSNACALLANGADESEISLALAGLQSDIIAALAGYEREYLPLNMLAENMLERVLTEEIGGFVRLTGGGWMPEHRQEFIDQCCVEFALLPASIIVPAIRQARRKVFDPKRFVSWVFEFIEKDLNRLEAEGKQLAELARIAGI